MTGLVLSDNDRTLSVPGTSNGSGIWFEDFVPPIPVKENTYAESADSNGRSRVRSRPQNGEGSVRCWIGAYTEAEFWDYVDEWQEMLESVHRAKGTLRYEPPRNGTPVTFDMESVQISEMPQKGTLLTRLIQEATFTFEALPYGRLDPVVVFSGENFSGPIDSVEIPDVPGHVDAFVELGLLESSGQARGWVEIGIQEDYDPASPEPLLLNLANGLTVSGYAGASTTRASSYSANVARATLSASPVVICATTAQPHKHHWKVYCRTYPSAPEIRVRLAWKVGDGPVTRERWVNVPGDSDFYELDLATINIEELPIGHSWTGYIEAYTTSGTPTLDVDYLDLMPS